MTSRADVNRLSASRKRAVEMARAELAGMFGTMDLSSPELVREALLEVVPALVREYGDLAAVAAAEWYEDVRAATVPGRYSARPAAGVAPERVEGSVRYAARHLFGDDPMQTLAVLSGAIQRHISYSTRETIRREVARDARRPRFARVPTGAKTCAWCEMLSSRGFVYRSRETAGIDDGHYHDDCNCEIVADFDRGAAHIAGYDPDAAYDRYQRAWNAAGGVGSTGDQVAYQLRRLYPDIYTDGVYERAA